MTIYMGGKQGDTWTFCILHPTVVLFQNLLCKNEVRFSEFHNTSTSHQNARVRQEWSEIFFFKPLLQVFCQTSCSCTIHHGVCNFDCIWIKYVSQQNHFDAQGWHPREVIRWYYIQPQDQAHIKSCFKTISVPRIERKLGILLHVIQCITPTI
jgi:hypothetical protein